MKVSSKFSLKDKIITFERAMSELAGDVQYTGVGFKPKSIIFLAVIDLSQAQSLGFCDEKLVCCCDVYDDSNNCWSQTQFVIHIINVSGVWHRAIVKSLDNDGFTLTWTSDASVASIIKCVALCLG